MIGYVLHKTGTLVQVRDRRCLGCRCFKPGLIRRETGSAMCMTRAKDRCPVDIEFTAELREKRRAEGWTNIKPKRPRRKR